MGKSERNPLEIRNDNGKIIYICMTKTMLMNKPEAYNKAEILNLSLMTDELSINSPIAIVDFQNNDNQAVINSAIMIAELKDCKPMGVATYKTTAEMPEELRKALPDVEELKKLL